MSTNYPPPQPPYQKPPQPAYGQPQYGYGYPPVKAPNPIGTAGFWLAMAGILSMVVNGVIGGIWGYEAQNQGITSFEGGARYALRKAQLNPGVLVIRWTGLSVGLVGMIVSIVGMRRPGAKRGLAVTGLVLGILCSVCTVVNVIGLFMTPP